MAVKSLLRAGAGSRLLWDSFNFLFRVAYTEFLDNPFFAFDGCGGVALRLCEGNVE